MNKQKTTYNDLEMEVVRFQDEDAIRTSNGGKKDPDELEWD